MKYTLEKAMAVAIPENNNPEWTDLESQINYFLYKGKFFEEINSETLKRHTNIRNLSYRWGTLMWLFGLVYRIRIEYDASILIDRIGLTPEEDQLVVDAFSILRRGFNSYKKPVKNSVTKMLYDRVSSFC